jgi:outer membrane lipoprotein carrier protein
MVKPLLWLILLGLTVPLWAAPKASSIQQLVEKLGHIQAMRADFSQQLISADGVSLQKSSGEMMFARPGKFRWHTLKPFEQLSVSDGQQLWIYDQDLQQVMIRPVAGQVKDSPALLLSGDAQGISQAFQVTGRQPKANQWYFLLKPKAKDSLFERVSLTFVGNKLSHMVLVDSLGQQTEVTFSDIVINPQLKASLFHFQPPSGVDIINQPSGSP